MKFLLITVLLALAPLTAQADVTTIVDAEIATEMRPPHDPRGPRGSYFDWGTAQNGFGYCYEWTFDGRVLNGGAPVANYMCEARRPSMHLWGMGRNGYGYCYQYTPRHVPMNEGRPQANYLCEQRHPSAYRWGTSKSGHTYCYQYAPNGLVLNDGNPVAQHLCRY